ncbi:MAG: tyrosine-type recombinase/integrase, partial [Rhodospirillaceae bacterium]|nr:tyrosine-type recombinase/integrase [Rhodospirillaceae bacterium]
GRPSQITSRPDLHHLSALLRSREQLMDSLAETASGEWVVPGDSGDGPLTKNALYRFWTKARDMVGIVADGRLHDLRHAHASRAVMNGESLQIAGRLLGHRRASTTNTYVHVDDARGRSDARAVDGLPPLQDYGAGETCHVFGERRRRR